DGPVAENRADPGVEPGQDALRLSESVDKDDRSPSLGGIPPPPVVDGLEDLRLRLPAVDGQPERRFGDQRVTADELKSAARRIGSGLVISGNDAHFTAMFDADLCRTQDVPRGVQGGANAVQ